MSRISNLCQIFKFCANESHANMHQCMKTMDDYYGAMVDGEKMLLCPKCLYIAKGSFKKYFYRDHGDHLGELSQGDKSIAIMKGIVLSYSFFNDFNYIFL